MKEIYFLMDGLYDVDCLDGRLAYYNTFRSTEIAIDKRITKIATTSLIHMSFDLLDLGYDIYLVNKDKKIKIEPGKDIPNGKEIRKEHNLIKLFLGGYFNELLDI